MNKRSSIRKKRIAQVWLLIRNQWPEKTPDSEFHANQVIFCDFSPPYWIGYFEFLKFDFWFETSNPKNPKIAKFMQARLNFAILIRHLCFWKISEYDFIFALLAWFLMNFRRNEYYKKITLKIMHILKILSFLTVFEKMYKRRDDSERFDGFFGVISILNFQNNPLTNFLCWFLWK